MRLGFSAGARAAAALFWRRAQSRCDGERIPQVRLRISGGTARLTGPEKLRGGEGGGGLWEPA